MGSNIDLRQPWEITNYSNHEAVQRTNSVFFVPWSKYVLVLATKQVNVFIPSLYLAQMVTLYLTSDTNLCHQWKIRIYFGQEAGQCTHSVFFVACSNADFILGPEHRPLSSVGNKSIFLPQGRTMHLFWLLFTGLESKPCTWIWTVTS